MCALARDKYRARAKRAVSVAAALFLAAGLLTVWAETPAVPVGFTQGPGDSLPAGWKPWILKNVKSRTVYRMAGDGSNVLVAIASASASGLMRNITIDPREYPIVQWNWKIANTIPNADILQKEKNDSPARLYVAFAYDINKVSLTERVKYWAARRIYSDLLPLRAIAYTWANTTPKETIASMPYTEWFKQIVVENRSSPVNEWITEERNVFRDYRKAFGEDPQNITAVAVMTNTDNLSGKATAWYADIVFGQERR